jgi:hypothetical protein
MTKEIIATKMGLGRVTLQFPREVAYSLTGALVSQGLLHYRKRIDGRFEKEAELSAESQGTLEKIAEVIDRWILEKMPASKPKKEHYAGDQNAPEEVRWTLTQPQFAMIKRQLALEDRESQR